MMNLKSLMSLMLLSLMATSCLTLDGHIDVKQTMAVRKKSGFLGRKTKEVQIQPGLYTAELKVKGDKNFTLKLDGPEKISIPIKSENNLNVPSNGRVSISHADVNQPFDISGNIDTDVSRSESIRAIEACTWSVTERHCEKICDKPDSCRIECKDVLVTFDGRQEVIFHYRTIHRDLLIDFLKVEKGEVLASFHGTDTQVDRINEFEGICR